MGAPPINSCVGPAVARRWWGGGREGARAPRPTWARRATHADPSHACCMRKPSLPPPATTHRDPPSPKPISPGDAIWEPPAPPAGAPGSREPPRNKGGGGVAKGANSPENMAKGEAWRLGSVVSELLWSKCEWCGGAAGAGAGPPTDRDCFFLFFFRRPPTHAAKLVSPSTPPRRRRPADSAQVGPLTWRSGVRAAPRMLVYPARVAE